jgi:hypothetical protein
MDRGEIRRNGIDGCNHKAPCSYGSQSVAGNAPPEAFQRARREHY